MPESVPRHGSDMVRRPRVWKHLLVYVVVRGLEFVVLAAPPRIGYVLADLLGDALYRLIKRRRLVALENAAKAFPELSPLQIERLVRDTYRHFARLCLEVLLARRKWRSTTWRRYLHIDRDVEQDIVSAFRSSRPVLTVTAHMGGWELAGLGFGYLGCPMNAIARPLDNPFLERFVRRLRCFNGMNVIAKHGDFERLDDLLHHGGNIVTLADQDAGRKGLFVDFFGRPASTHKAVAVLAIKYDALILVGVAPRVARQSADPAAAPGCEPMYFSYELAEVIDPRLFAAQSRSAAVQAMTQRYTAAIEQSIRQFPDQYFWPHRRWKTQPVSFNESSNRAAA